MISLGESKQQDVERQTQEASPGDVEEPSPELGDGSSEKGSKKTETTPETGDDFGSDKVKVEITEATPSEAAQVADTLTEEPETEEQAERPGRDDEAAKPQPPAKPQAAPVAEPQPPTRATPLYWRRLTSRYMSMPPPPS